jgi:hypothetical protein
MARMSSSQASLAELIGHGSAPRKPRGSLTIVALATCCCATAGSPVPSASGVPTAAAGHSLVTIPDPGGGAQRARLDGIATDSALAFTLAATSARLATV